LSAVGSLTKHTVYNGRVACRKGIFRSLYCQPWQMSEKMRRGVRAKSLTMAICLYLQLSAVLLMPTCCSTLQCLLDLSCKHQRERQDTLLPTQDTGAGAARQNKVSRSKTGSIYWCARESVIGFNTATHARCVSARRLHLPARKEIARSRCVRATLLHFLSIFQRKAGRLLACA
jgi:hypothetical protein